MIWEFPKIRDAILGSLSLGLEYLGVYTVLGSLYLGELQYLFCNCLAATTIAAAASINPKP